jgi:hypothetical protein
MNARQLADKRAKQSLLTTLNLAAIGQSFSFIGKVIVHLPFPANCSGVGGTLLLAFVFGCFNPRPFTK